MWAGKRVDWEMLLCSNIHIIYICKIYSPHIHFFNLKLKISCILDITFYNGSESFAEGFQIEK